MFDFRRSRQCSDLRRKSSSQPTGDPPQIAGSVCINPHQKFVGSSLRIGERPVNQRCVNRLWRSGVNQRPVNQLWHRGVIQLLPRNANASRE